LDFLENCKTGLGIALQCYANSAFFGSRQLYPKSGSGVGLW